LSFEFSLVSSFVDRQEPGGNPIWKCRGYSPSRLQIEDSGLASGVDDETSPFLAVKSPFGVHSKK